MAKKNMTGPAFFLVIGLVRSLQYQTHRTRFCQTVKASSDDEDNAFDPRISPHSYDESQAASARKQKIGVIVVDHGSKVEKANTRLEEICAIYAQEKGGDFVVRPAHMEIASPSISEAFDDCVAQGCDFVVCHPYFLGVGRHPSKDVPRLFAEASLKHPHVQTVVTKPLGHNVPLLLDLVDSTVRSTIDETLSAEIPPPFEDTFFGSIQAAMNEAQQQSQQVQQ